MFRQMLIEEREIGIHDCARREIFVEEFLDEQTGFFYRRKFQGVVQFVVVVKGGGRRAVVDLAEVEPIVGERVDEPAGLRIFEQTIGLGAEDFGIAEPALSG